MLQTIESLAVYWRIKYILEEQLSEKCYDIKDKNMRGVEEMVIMRESGKTREMCVILCWKINSCRSFSVNNASGDCEVNLLKSDHVDMTLITDATAEGYEFYDRIQELHMIVFTDIVFACFMLTVSHHFLMNQA